MKVRFWYNSANLSCFAEVIDINTRGYTEEMWKNLSDEEKRNEAILWAYENGLDIGCEDITKFNT